MSINDGPLTTYIEQGAAYQPPFGEQPPVGRPPTGHPPAPPTTYNATSMKSDKGAPVPVRFDAATTIEYEGADMQGGSAINANTLDVIVSDTDEGLWSVNMVPGQLAGTSFVHWALGLIPLDFEGAGGMKGPERDANGSNAGNFAISFGSNRTGDVHLPPGNYVLSIGRPGPSAGIDNKRISFIKQA